MALGPLDVSSKRGASVILIFFVQEEFSGTIYIVSNPIQNKKVPVIGQAAGEALSCRGWSLQTPGEEPRQLLKRPAGFWWLVASEAASGFVDIGEVMI